MTAFDPVEIFQTSTMAALLDGVYEGTSRSENCCATVILAWGHSTASTVKCSS